MRKSVSLITTGHRPVWKVLRLLIYFLETYGIRYLKYFGDGDSSSFNAIKNIYPGVLSQKYECLGHYQKRVGNRLRKLRQRVKGLGGKSKVKEVIKTTADGKITKTKQKPRGKLTDNVINILQNYFGIALCSGAKTVAELKNKLLASSSNLITTHTVQLLVTVGVTIKGIK